MLLYTNSQCSDLIAVTDGSRLTIEKVQLFTSSLLLIGFNRDKSLGFHVMITYSYIVFQAFIRTMMAMKDLCKKVMYCAYLGRARNKD